MSGAMTDNKEEEGVLVACKTVGSVMCADYRKLIEPNQCVMSSRRDSVNHLLQKPHKPKSRAYGIMLGFAKIRS
ncbi:hypothetical protein CKO18_08385 [Rhodoferax fermentans]|nr:hypothetical protein [Rhodoferax fermentans]